MSHQYNLTYPPMLSTNPRTHILELTRDREIPITEHQYTSLKQAQRLSSYNDVLEIKDPDTWAMLHDWLWRDFSGFREIKKPWWNYTWWICDYATHHTMSEDTCNCHSKYNFPPIVFRTKLFELFPLKYPSTITNQEKQIILKAI